MRAGWALFTTAWLVCAVALGTLCRWLGSLHSYGQHTRAQVSLAVGLCVLSAAWLAAEACALAAGSVGAAAEKLSPARSGAESAPGREPGRDCELLVGRGPAEESPKGAGQVHCRRDGAGDLGQQGAAAPESCQLTVIGCAGDHSPKRSSLGHASAEAAEQMPPRSPLAGELASLRACGELTAIVAAMYVCDRTDVFAAGPKVADRRYFWGLWTLVCVAALASAKSSDRPKPLQRDQTDEWKGWMQVMFVLYHYFKEDEVYNAIRVYIAAYVFLTGYGNYSLYVRGRSFTLRRNFQMVFRLNFLGFIACAALNNEYMLYYICGMHTFFTILVIVMLYVKQALNGYKWWMYVKIGIAFSGICALYDGPAVLFQAVFGLLPGTHFLFAFHDPVHPEYADDLHEWHFRSGLDRFIWIYGMVCAVFFPEYEAFIEWIESRKVGLRAAWNGALLLATLLLASVWVGIVFSREKLAYNAVHAYTSWLPVSLYILTRNLTATARKRYLGVFAYMGKYTLETYILQFHVWMKTTGVNGSPKKLLVVVPDYFWINFVARLGSIPVHVSAHVQPHRGPAGRHDTRGEFCDSCQMGRSTELFDCLLGRVSSAGAEGACCGGCRFNPCVTAALRKQHATPRKHFSAPAVEPLCPCGRTMLWARSPPLGPCLSSVPSSRF
ncbi:unnamed protein product [Prorocentrum cordatum]|uniref:Cas1p 10 TM acyl transferase domain-containing protein n=1 Tax=Prorocentrum cordatum TaxID=2364126 RepID=A0ABN9UQH5_9DINO|nr:unnamed protein product [Polarella glacialis]